MNYKQNEKINQVKESTLVNYIDKTSIKSKKSTKSTKSTKFDLFCKISTGSEHVYCEGVLQGMCKRNNEVMNTKEKTKKIHELKKLLDWYIDCASDEEFDSDVVISLLHQLDALEPIVTEPMESVEVFITNFWEYCRRRENEERSLRSFAECPANLQVKHYHRKSCLQSFLHLLS